MKTLLTILALIITFTAQAKDTETQKEESLVSFENTVKSMVPDNQLEIDLDPVAYYYAELC